MESPRSHQVHPSTWGRDPANHPDGWYFLNSPLALQYRVCPRNIHIFAHLLNINSMQVSEPLHSWPLRPHRKCPQKGRENAAWRQPILQSPYLDCKASLFCSFHLLWNSDLYPPPGRFAKGAATLQLFFIADILYTSIQCIYASFA